MSAVRVGHWAVPIAIAVLLAACTQPSPQNPATSLTSVDPSFDQGLAVRLQKALEDAVAETGVPGAQAAVILSDGSMWSGGAGLAETDSGQPMTPDLLMPIASITKLYTAALVLHLAQDGVLSLDDPLERWVQGVPNSEGVTVRHLLTHTSGLASDDQSLPPVCQPGACYSYSGAFSLLGQAVEEATSREFAAVLRERILSPAGLAATFYPRQEPTVGDSATGYSFGEAKSAVEVATGMQGPAWRGAGGDLVATAADTARFVHALFTGSVLEPQTLEQMLDFEATRGLPGTSDCTGQGMAVQRRRGDLGESWFHGGRAGYFRSWVEHFPGQEVTVAVIVNADVPAAAFIAPLSREALAEAPLVNAGTASGRCNYDIAVLAADGTARLVTADPGFDGLPSWSPDGKRLVWIGTRDGQSDVFAVSLDGSEPVMLTADPARDVFPRWSPDGTTIAFSSNRDGDYEIYLMAPDGTGVKPVTHNDRDDLLPAWSPDGKRIAYVNERDGQHVHAVEADGSGDLRVTDGRGDEWWPAWSPDGKRIVYESGGVPYIVAAEGGPAVRLPIPQIRVTEFLAWWPGQDIVFSAYLDLWAVAEDGSGLRRLTATSTEESAPAWSPDGTAIAYQHGHWEEPEE